METKPFDVILFDLGGVLIQYRERPRILDWFDGKVSLEEIWRFWLTSDLVRDFETGRIAPEAFAERMIREQNLPVSVPQYLEGFAESFDRVYPGVEELLRRLAPRYTLAVLSNNNETLWRRCEGFGIFPHFRHLFSSHLIGCVKPDRAAYERVIAELKVPPERILFLDDTAVNVTAAQGLGIRACQVRGIDEVERQLQALGV